MPQRCVQLCPWWVCALDQAPACLKRVCIYVTGLFFRFLTWWLSRHKRPWPRRRISQSPMEPACRSRPFSSIHPTIHPSIHPRAPSSHHSYEPLAMFLPSFTAAPLLLSWMSVLLFNASIWVSFYFNPFRPCHYSSSHIRVFFFFLTTLIIAATVIAQITSSLCFRISSSSTTPLSIALQAVDERTLLVMAEQRRSPDALDRPGPIYLSGSWCSVTWGNNAQGHHKYSFTSA